MRAFQLTVQVEEDDLDAGMGRPQGVGQLAADITAAARYDDSGERKRPVHISLSRSEPVVGCLNRLVFDRLSYGLRP